MDIIQQIKELCERCTKNEDYCDDVYGYSGGNIDDAYSIGCEYGESNLAKEILKLIIKDQFENENQ